MSNNEMAAQAINSMELVHANKRSFWLGRLHACERGLGSVEAASLPASPSFEKCVSRFVDLVDH